MGESKKSSETVVYSAYVVVALFCGMATCGMGMVAYNIISRFTTVSNFMVFCLAAMVVPPALMGVGVASFIYKTHLAQLKYRYGKVIEPELAE